MTNFYSIITILIGPISITRYKIQYSVCAYYQSYHHHHFRYDHQWVSSFILYYFYSSINTKIYIFSCLLSIGVVKGSINQRTLRRDCFDSSVLPNIRKLSSTFQLWFKNYSHLLHAMTQLDNERHMFVSK